MSGHRRGGWVDVENDPHSNTDRKVRHRQGLTTICLGELDEKILRQRKKKKNRDEKKVRPISNGKKK